MLAKATDLVRTMVGAQSQLSWLVAIFGGMVLLILGLTAKLVEVTWLGSAAS
jgi:hypothetical protein